MMMPEIIICRRRTVKLALPLAKASRLQFHCGAVSKDFIVFGTSAGSIYIFDRTSLDLLKFVGVRASALTGIQFSPDEKGLAVADINGIVSTFEVDIENCLFKPLRDFFEHKGSKVNAMCWDDSSARLFIGNNHGKVTSNMVFPFKLSAGKFLSKSTTETILKEDRAVVQLDFFKERLLVSTYSRTLLCLTDKSQFLQIGSKPRDGQYGSCFLRVADTESPSLYCARPGARLWEVDSSGHVIATHQFKNTLAKLPLEILGQRQDLPPSTRNWSSPHAVHFPKLISFKERCLVTWSQHGLYLIDPTYGKIADWYDQVKDIKDIFCHQDTIFIFHLNGHVTELVYANLKECLSELNKLEEWSDFLKVSVTYRNSILGDPESYIAFDFQDIIAKTQTMDLKKEFIDDFTKLAHDLEEKHNAVKAAIVERMDLLPDVSVTPTDSGVEDNDEVRSVGNISEASSSRMSLSRLADLDVDGMMQRAKSALVNRIVNSGFIQKALKDAMDAEERRHGKNAIDLNEFSEAAALNDTQEITVHAANVVPDTKPVSLLGKTTRVFSKPRRRRKPKTVDFGQGRKTESIEKLSRRSLSLGGLNVVAEKDTVKLTHSSPPSPSLGDTYHRNDDNISVTMESLSNTESLESVSGRNSPKSPHGSYNRRFGRILYQPNMDAMNLISELVDVTAYSRNKLRDTRILYNPTGIRSVLKDWVEKFDTVLKKYTQSCISSSSLSRHYETLSEMNKEAFKMYIREDFFRRLGVAFSEVSNLALLCFESKIFPESCKILTTLEKRLINRTLTLDDCQKTVKRITEIFAFDSHEKKERRSLERNWTTSSFGDNASTTLSELNESKTMPQKSQEDSGSLLETSEQNRNVGSEEQVASKFSDEVSAAEVLGPGTTSSNRTLEGQSKIDCNIDRSHSCALELEKSAYLSCTSSVEYEQQFLFCRNGNAENCDTCDQDISSACFVIRCFSLLDVGRIRKILSWSSSCRWRTWLAYFIRNGESCDFADLLQAIRKEDWGKVSRVLLELSAPEQFLAVVEELFEVQPALVKDCMKTGLLYPWEVHFISILILNGHVYDEAVLLYLAKQSCSHSYQDKQILAPLLKHMTAVDTVKDRVVCVCGKAKPGSHTRKLALEDSLQMVVSMVVRKFKSDLGLLKRLIVICSSEGYWKGSLKLLAAIGQTTELLDLCQQLQDSTLLDELTADGLIAFSAADWIKVLTDHQIAAKNLEDRKRLDNEHSCGLFGSDFIPSWTMEKLLWCMLRSIGSKRSLEVVQHLPDSGTKIFDGFYFACMQIVVLEKCKRKSINRVREIVCSDARAKGQSYMATVLEEKKNEELRELIANHSSEAIGLAGLSLRCANVGFDEGQWGRDVILFGSICNVCTLPLTTQAGFSSAGIIIFRCGHCFHRKCVPEECCITCFLSGFKTIEPKR